MACAAGCGVILAMINAPVAIAAVRTVFGGMCIVAVSQAAVRCCNDARMPYWIERYFAMNGNGSGELRESYRCERDAGLVELAGGDNDATVRSARIGIFEIRHDRRDHEMCVEFAMCICERDPAWWVARDDVHYCRSRCAIGGTL